MLLLLAGLAFPAALPGTPADPGRAGARKAESKTDPGGSAGSVSAGKGDGQRTKADEHAMRGVMLLRQGKYQEAEKELLEADRLRPNYGPVLDQLSTVQDRLGKPEQALATLERLIRRGEPFDDRAYILAAQAFAGKKMYTPGEEKLLEWAGGRPVSPNFHVAIAILRMGVLDLATAEVALREAIKSEPTNEPALKAMFQIYDRFKRYDMFQPFLDRALAEKPNSVPLLMLSGSNLMRQDRFAEARGQFEKILKLDPRNAAAWVNLGSSVHSLGDEEEGMRDFRRAIELDGKNMEAPINLSLGLERAQKFPEARDVLISARRRGIEATDLLNALAMAHHLNKEFDAAIAVASESLKRDPHQESMRRFLERIKQDKSAQASAGPGEAPGSP